jgi:DnaJ family protein C protein 3
MTKADRLAVCNRGIDFANAHTSNDESLLVELLCWRAETHLSAQDNEKVDFDAAIGDATHAQQKAGNNMNLRNRAQRLLQDAQKQKKVASRVDHYKVLGVTREASTREISKAFRKLAAQNHPDKLAASLSEEEKETFHKRYVEISQAYEILRDEDLRRRYDQGDDVETYAERDGQQAGNPFGGNPFGGGFPGGFNFQFRQG